MKPSAIKIITTLLLGLIVFTAAPARAQAPGNGPGPGGPPPMDQASRDKLERRVEQMIIWELSEVMSLPSNKDEKFFDVMREHFRLKRELTEQQFASMNSLQKIYQNKNATEAEMRKALDQLEAQYEKQLKLELQLHKDLKKVLTAREQARFVIEWPKIQKKVRETIMQRKTDMQRGAEQHRNGMKMQKK
jgi:Spy/CpxP family protein refolding chaperone